MPIQNTDKFLVNRNNVNYQIEAQDIMTIQDTDLFVVDSGGTHYKVTGEKIKTYIGSGVIIYSPGENEILTQSSFNIKSSVWYSTTGVTHLSSTWQLSLSTDPTFSSPVLNDISSTINLTSWYVSGLTPGTSYIVRVTYNLSNATSVTSNTVSFSISPSASPFVVTPPSSILSSSYATTQPINQYISPVPLNSIRYSPAGSCLLATTTSGRIISFSLSSATTVGTGQLNTTPLPNGDLAYDAFCGSSANNTYYINQEGLIKAVGIPPFSLPAGLLSQKIVTVSPYDQFGSVCVRTELNELWVITSPSVQIGASGNGRIPVSASSYLLAWSPTSQSYFTAPSGEIPIKVISYNDNYVIWLTDSKNAYLTSQFVGASNGSAPIPIATSSQGTGATNTDPVKIRPYPFGSAPDYVWEDIFSADLTDFGGAVTTATTYGFWGYTSDGKVKGAYGWATSGGPGETGGSATTLNATDGGWFGDKVVMGVTGTWGFSWDGTAFGVAGQYYYDQSGNLFYTSGWGVGSQVTVDIPGYGFYSRTQPLALGQYNASAVNFKLLQSKPVTQ